jgi:hypothetical protein
VIGSLAILAAAALVLIGAIVVLMTRRVRADDRFEHGSVSQQWLIGHRDER